MSNKLEQLKKQNEGIYNGLEKNGVPFTRKGVPETHDEETLMKFYQEENQELKKAMAEFRKNQPKPEPKPKNNNPPQAPATQQKKEQKKKDEDEEHDEAEDEVLAEKKPSYSTIVNMEDIKRAFFNDEIENFLKLAKEQPYLFFEAKYKYNEDMDGRPDYVAKNLVNGFVKNLDDKRRYFMNCFRCYNKVSKEDKTYTYPSLWIVNTNDNLKDVTEDFSEDFEFTKVEQDHLDEFLQKFQKVKNDESLVNEAYLH